MDDLTDPSPDPIFVSLSICSLPSLFKTSMSECLLQASCQQKARCNGEDIRRYKRIYILQLPKRSAAREGRVCKSVQRFDRRYVLQLSSLYSLFIVFSRGPHKNDDCGG